jgi:hypothetical protein
MKDFFVALRSDPNTTTSGALTAKENEKEE